MKQKTIMRMRAFFQPDKSDNNSKDKIINRSGSRILFVLTIALFISLMSASDVFAASLKLNYDGKNVTYSGKQVSVTADGKSINMKNTPGIIINNTALVSYYDIFKKGLGADCTYNSSKGTVTIKQYDQTIVLTIGSNTAVVNGVKKKVSVAPKKVKFIKSNTTKIYVPARFVAEELGYTYIHNSTTATSTLTSPLRLYYDGKWNLYKGTRGNVTVNGTAIDVSRMKSVILQNTALLQAKKVFTSPAIGASYSYDKKTKSATIEKDDVTIVVTMGSNIAYVNDVAMKMDTAARLIKDSARKTNYVMVPGYFVAGQLGYDYTWNSASKTSIISDKVEEPELGGDPVSPEDSYVSYMEWNPDATFTNESMLPGMNYIMGVKAYNEAGVDKVTINGYTNFTYNITGDSNNIYIDFTQTATSFGSPTITGLNAKSITGISATNNSDYTTRITIQKNAESDYYISESTTNLTLVFSGATTGVTSMRIPKPVEVPFSSIVEEDLYFDNAYVITIPGNQVAYLTANPIKINSSAVIDHTVSLNDSGDTEITIYTSHIQGFELTDGGDHIAVRIANPSEIYDKIVVLDPGHGGADGGARYNGVNEKDLNLKILYEIASNYFDSPSSSIKAYYTRVDDYAVNLYDRPAFVEEVEADLFISLHMNSATKTANGTEVYYSSNNNDISPMGLNSATLAKIFANGLSSSLGMYNRGPKNNGFVVVKYNTVPAILIELGFMTNSSDFSKLTNAAFQQKAAQEIYNLTEQVFNQYPTGR